MIQDYFGQETIWKLLGTHPYEKNVNRLTLRYDASTPRISKDISDNFLLRIPKDKIIDVEMQDAPNEWQVNGFYGQVVRRIVVRNVFGNESEVIISNG